MCVLHHTVDDKVIALPACLGGLVGIEEEQHPVGVGIGSDCLVGLHRKVDILLVHSYVGAYDIVSSCLVCVMQIAVSVMVAMYHVASRVGKILCEQRPVLQATVHNHFLQASEDRYGVHTFVPTYVLHHLHVIVVRPSALHGCDGPIELSIVLVHKIERILSIEESGWACCLSGWVLATAVSACSPLVPVVQIDEFGVHIQSLVPSVLEVDAILSRAVHHAIHCRTIGGYGHVVVIQRWFARLSAPTLPHDAHGMLGGSDCHLLHAPLVSGTKFIG